MTPKTSIVPNPSGRRRTTRQPAYTTPTYSAAVTTAPNRPSSSPKELMMKSLLATGTISGWPPPKPVPNMPPVPKPNSDCWIW